MFSILSTIFAAALVNNLVFVQIVGVSSLFALTHRLQAATEMAVLSFLVMFPAMLLSVLSYRLILVPLGLEYLALLLFVAISSCCASALLLSMGRRFPLLLRRHHLALALLGGNSAIVGGALLGASSLLSNWQLLAYCFGAAAGFAFALLAFAALRQRLEFADTPLPLRGPAIELISAGIVAMCFLGFAGLV